MGTALNRAARPGYDNAIDLVRLLKAVWYHGWLVVLGGVLGLVLAFGYTKMFISPRYQADAKLYVNNKGFSLGTTTISVSDLNSSANLVNMYVVILRTRTVLNKVIEKADLPYTAAQLSGMLSVSQVNNTPVFSVTVTNPDPAVAEKIANTVCAVLPEAISKVVDGTSVRVVDYAILPTTPIAPNVTRNTLLGGLVGAVLCAGFVCLLTLMDDTIMTEEDLRQRYDLPILAAVPDLMVSGHGSYGGYSSYYGGYYRRAPEKKASDKGAKKGETKK